MTSVSHKLPKLEGESSQEILGGDAWVEFYSRCVSILRPNEHCSSVQDYLNWTAANSASLVREVARGPDYGIPSESLFLALAWKKWRFADEACAEERRVKAFDGFRSRNAAAEKLPLPDGHTLDRMRYYLKRWLPFVGVSPGRFGPGACYEKVKHPRRWEIISPYLTNHYRQGIVHARDKLFDVSAEHNIADASFSDSLRLADSDCEMLYKHDAARLCAVPKDWNKDRLITVEPLFRSYLQQSVRSTLLESIHTGPLRGSAMDPLADGQHIQRTLAMSGSATGLLATIDLSDASDNITADLVYSVFPPWVCTLLEQCRSPYYEGTDHLKYPLFIYAGMGNATTFIVESLIFASYCAAMQWRAGIRGMRPSVFGDDIIVSSDTAKYLLDNHDDFFRINPDKSFMGTDRLRESCGVYAYQGNDVTPARFNGFRANYSGLVGLCEYVNQKAANHQPYQIRLAYQIGEELLRRSLAENWPFSVEGHPDISLDGLPYSPLPEMRFNTGFQFREAKVAVCEPVNYWCYCDRDAWALQASLSGSLSIRPYRSRYIATFTERDAWQSPRKRWRRCVYL